MKRKAAAIILILLFAAAVFTHDKQIGDRFKDSVSDFGADILPADAENISNWLKSHGAAANPPETVELKFDRPFLYGILDPGKRVVFTGLCAMDE